MRAKSVEKFKDKIRERTPRHHNLDAQVVKKVNAVVRGTANYFATPFSKVVDPFRTLDRWLRMRIRCMKFKCKRKSDHWRLQRKHLTNLGLVFLSDPRTRPKRLARRLPWVRFGPPWWALLKGSPDARKGHVGQSGESPPSRQRGGRGMTLSLTLSRYSSHRFGGAQKKSGGKTPHSKVANPGDVL